MLESERLAYLNALGITQYVALDVIPGAYLLPELAPEQIWTDAEPVDQVATGSSAVPAVPLSDAPVTSPSPPLQMDEKPAQAEPEQVAPTAVTASAVETGEVPQLDLNKLKLEREPDSKPAVKPQAKAQRFALAVITIPDQFRFFVELSQADAPGLSAREHRMLADLLSALGQGDALDQFGAKLYRWPLVENPRIAADQQAAREALLGFVSSAPPVTRSVFLGLRAAAVLGVAEPGQVFNLAGVSGNEAISTHSLAEMEADWRLKPSAWNHILPFLTPHA